MPQRTQNPTPTQLKALRMIAKRDHPGGEPRMGWLNANTARVLLLRGWIVEREGFDVDGRGRWGGHIVDLTPTGVALVQHA